MKRSLSILLGTLVVLSMLLSACAPAATPAPTTAPTTAPKATDAPKATEPAKATDAPKPTEAPKATVAAAPTQPAPVKIQFVNWIGAEDATKPAVQAMLAGFQKKYPWITVENMPIPFNNSKDQLLVMATGGTPPDISMLHTTWVAPMVEAGVLAPLDDLLLNKADYLPVALSGKAFNGKQMAVTWAPSVVVLYYNKLLLEKAGFKEGPKTWDEMLKMARAVAKLGKDASGNQIYGFGVSSKKLAGAGYFNLPFMTAYGGKYQDGAGKININSPENVAAFKELKALFEEKVTPEGLEIRDLRNLFATGNMAFHLDIEAGIGIFAGLSPKKADFAKDYGIMVIPGKEAGKPLESIMIEHTLAIYKESKHQKEAAMLLDYLTGPEGMALYNAAAGPKFPGRTSTAKIDYYSKPENAFTKVYIDEIAVSQPLPAQSSAFLSAMEEVSVAIQRVGINKEDPAVVVKDLDAKVKGLYKQ